MITKLPNKFIQEPESLGIKSEYKVLDLGGGHNPYKRADIVLERFTEDNTHRSGSKVSSYDIVGDCENLPFKDKSFDFIYCHQVLEHLNDPIRAVKEMFRVSNKGFISVPHIMFEMMYQWNYHKWYCYLLGDTLHLQEKPKKDKQRFGKFFEMLGKKMPDWEYIFNKNDDLWHIEFTWADYFNIELHFLEE